MQRTALVALHFMAYGIAAGTAPPPDWPWALILACLLIWVSVVDVVRFEIPDLAVVALIGTGSVRIWLTHNLDLTEHLAGALLWPALTLAVATAYARVRGWEGLGLGDVKLLAGLGLWAGFALTVWIVLVAALAGILTLVVLAVVRGKGMKDMGVSAIAFGPFLCFATWVITLHQGALP